MSDNDSIRYRSARCRPKDSDPLVGEKPAACVNQSECRPTFRWDDEIVQANEIIRATKTMDRHDDAVARLETIHPHGVACIGRFDETDRADSFAEWISESVA